MFERSEKEEPAVRVNKKKGGKVDGATLAKSNKAEQRKKDAQRQLHGNSFEALTGSGHTGCDSRLSRGWPHTQIHTRTRHLYVFESTMSVAYVCHMETAEDFKGCFTL